MERVRNPFFSVSDALKLEVSDFLRDRISSDGIEALESQVCYVRMIFGDGSFFGCYTTLNSSILSEHFATRRDGYFYDVKKERYLAIPESCQHFEVFKDLPKLEIVEEFINSFI